MTKPSLMIRPETRPTALSVVGELVTPLATRGETGSYEVFLQSGPRGAGPPPHHHPWEESYFVIDGEIEVSLGEERQTVGAGTFIHIPAGTVHTYRTHSAHASFISITSPGGAAAMFADIAREAPEVPPDLPKLARVVMRHGLVPGIPVPGL